MPKCDWLYVCEKHWRKAAVFNRMMSILTSEEEHYGYVEHNRELRGGRQAAS